MRIATPLLLVVLLSGCIESTPDDDALPDSPDGTTSSTPVPTWAVGHYWSYTTSDGGSFDLVVAEDQGTTWQLLSSDLDIAYYDWSPGLSFVGTIQKSDLGGKQGSGFVKFFDWPLEDGKTWTTTWDDASRAIVATAEDDGTWSLEAFTDSTPSGDLFARYTYDPDVGYFERLAYISEEDQSEAFVLTRNGHGASYSGSAYRYTSVDEVAAVAPSGPGNVASNSFEVDTEQEIQIDYAFTCGESPGTLQGSLTPPQEDTAGPPEANPPAWSRGYTCPADGSDEGQTVMAAIPGTWSLETTVGGLDATLEITVRSRAYDTYTF